MADVDNLEIRPWAPRDLPAVLELLRVSFGDAGIRWTEAVWRWKHLENPFGVSPGLLAISGDRPVALRLFLRWRFLDQEGAVVPAVRAVDTVTHPDWRGRGLFTRLTRELLQEIETEGVRLVFNTPNPRSRPGYLKMGWRKAGRVPLLLRVVRPWRLARALTATWESPLPDLSRFPMVTGHLEAPETGELVRAPAPAPRLTTDRCTDYLRWRYARPRSIPGLGYYALWDESAGARAGLIFRARRRRGLSEIDIAEILMPKVPVSAAVDLAARLLRRLARDSRPDILAGVAAPGAWERLAFQRAGFLPARALAPRLTVLQLRPLPPTPMSWTPEAPRGLTADAWRWSLGDLELF